VVFVLNVGLRHDAEVNLVLPLAGLHGAHVARVRAAQVLLQRE
jgi:hypothetical protein